MKNMKNKELPTVELWLNDHNIGHLNYTTTGGDNPIKIPKVIESYKELHCEALREENERLRLSYGDSLQVIKRLESELSDKDYFEQDEKNIKFLEEMMTRVDKQEFDMLEKMIDDWLDELKNKYML